MPNTNTPRTGAGLTPANAGNVKPINKPTTPAAHTVSPVPGGNKSAAAKGAAAETMLKKEIASKKPMTLDQMRQDVLKKTGSWPNGYTN